MKPNRTAIKARNAKVQDGIDKDLGKMPSIQLAGEAYNPSSLKAVFQADSAAMDATDKAKKAAQQAVLDEKATHAKTALVLSALRSFLLGYFGKQAVAILGDFDMKAPKSKATKTVATKAVAVAKAKATRKARGTMGTVQKKAVTGNVDAKAIEAAINTPTEVPSAKTAPAATPSAAPAGSPPPATTPAPAAPAQASTAPAAPKAGTSSPQS